jgi:hypothetical protein
LNSKIRGQRHFAHAKFKVSSEEIPRDFKAMSTLDKQEYQLYRLIKPERSMPGYVLQTSPFPNLTPRYTLQILFGAVVEKQGLYHQATNAGQNRLAEAIIHTRKNIKGFEWVLPFVKKSTVLLGRN